MVRSRSVFLVQIAAFAILSGLFSAQAQANPLELAPSMMSPDLIDVTYEHVPAGSSPAVFLLGENHASVKTQKQVATLIGSLLASGAAETILIEGSTGEIKVQDFIEEIAGLADAAQIDGYWSQELDSGRISGFEFVALTRPGTRVFGVEDMRAKAQHAVALVELELEAGIQPELFERAEGFLGEVLAAIAPKAPAEAVESAQAELEEFSETVRRYRETHRTFSDHNRPAVEIHKETIPLRFRMEEIIQNLPELEQYFEWGESVDKEIESYNALIDPRQKKAQEALVLLTQEGEGASQQLEKLGAEVEELDRRLEVGKERIELLRSKIEEYTEAHSSDMEELARLSQRLAELDAASEKFRESLETEAGKLREGLLNVEDGYFIAANLLEDLAGAADLEFPRLTTFFYDEAERSQESFADGHSAQLLARDRAMVANTVTLMEEEGLQTAILLIGSAHLEGVVKELKNRGVSFLGGKMKAADEEIEPWEQQTWEVRRSPQIPIFGSGGLKELTRLLDRSWKKEQIARLSFIRRQQLPGSSDAPSFTSGTSSIYEEFSNGLTLQKGEGVYVDRNANLGSYIKDHGSVPGEPGSSYVVYDRGTAKDQVDTLSDGTTIFTYHFKTSRDGRAQYRLLTPRGEMDPQTFMTDLPTGDPAKVRRVVLFGEADERPYRGRWRSPLWDALRGVNEPPDPGAGRGGGQVLPRSPGDPTSSGPGPNRPDPGANGGPGARWTYPLLVPGARRQRASLHRTLNPDRAQRNIKFLEQQKPIDPQEVSFVEEDSLTEGAFTRLKFTPRRGDYAPLVVLLARNTQEFRAAVKEAAQARKFKNKQVALITCGDAFQESIELRESLLREGVVMVWMPDRQLSPESGARLMKEVRDVLQTLPAGETPRDIDELMQRALESWSLRSPDDPDLRILKGSSSWVDNRLPSDAGPDTVPSGERWLKGV